MRQALSFKAVLAAAAIVLYLLVCMVFPRQILSLMVVGNSQADAILDEAVKYMFLMGFNGIPMAISTICSSSLREIGRVRTPLFISVIATLVNTFFNWVLVYGNLGAPRLEVQGATKDYLKVQYSGSDVLYVPVTQLDLLSRYTAPGDEEKVKLAKLGGAEWQRTRAKVKKATEGMKVVKTILVKNRLVNLIVKPC